MVKCVAYLRVSSAHQDEDNQRLGVDNLAKRLGLHIDKYIVDKVSGITEPKKRNLGRNISRLHAGDVLIVSELSRLSRHLFTLCEVLNKINKKGVKLYSVKENFVLDDSVASKTIIFAFGLSAEIERQLISQRTKEALAMCKLQGKKLGRPVGSKTKHHKLDDHIESIKRWRNKEWALAKMARKLKVCDKTLRKYIQQHL